MKTTHSSFCVEKEWSKESSKKLQQLVTPSTLPKLLVEMNAVVEVGRVFCQSTYTLEGDDPLVFTAYLVFERLNKTISELGNANSLSNTRQACKTASNLVSNLKQKFLEELEFEEAQAAALAAAVQVIRKDREYQDKKRCN